MFSALAIHLFEPFWGPLGAFGGPFVGPNTETFIFQKCVKTIVFYRVFGLGHKSAAPDRLAIPLLPRTPSSHKK